MNMTAGLSANSVVSGYYGPRGFHWLAPGLLGGAARPGLMTEIENDLEALARVKTKLLVTLTEEWQPDAALMARYGIDSLYLPIPDQFPPTLEEAREVCAIVDERLEAGEAVVYHCRAGKGRTGTMLAAQLIWRGVGAADALVETRRMNKYWIESQEQEDWLPLFDAFCQRGGATGPSPYW